MIQHEFNSRDAPARNGTKLPKNMTDDKKQTWDEWLEENGSPLNDDDELDEWVEAAGQLIPKRIVEESDEEITKQKLRNYSWF